MLPQKFLKHYYIIETLLQWNLYSGYSLRASSAFGGNREKLTHERHVRGDTKAGGVGEKGELATITSKVRFTKIVTILVKSFNYITSHYDVQASP